MIKEEIGIITSGFLPVPATKGGAVENLIVNMINENELTQEMNLVVFSCYDEKAVEVAKHYKKTRFVFFKTNKLFKILDKIIYLLAKYVLKKGNSQSYRYIIQRLSFLNSVSKELKINDYDRVVLENHPSQYLALKWRKNFIKYSGKYYYHSHNEFPGEYGCHDIIVNTEKIICVSEYIKQTLMKQLKMDISKFTVVRNCVDKNLFNNSFDKNEVIEFKKKFNIKLEEKVLLFTGRVVPEKGVYELIRAIKKVKYNNYKLLIVGSSLNALDSKSKFEEKIEKEIQGIEDKVIFTGFIRYEEISKIYKIADIAVIPSIWDDPAPLTIIESLNCGLPIISTNSGGITEYANEKCAVILERDEKLIDNLASTIDMLLQNDQITENMSRESLIAAKDLGISRYYNDFIKALNYVNKKKRFD